jgi:hypothetical protein
LCKYISRSLLIQDIDGNYHVRVLVNDKYAEGKVDYDYESIMSDFIEEIVFIHRRDLTAQEPFDMEEEFRYLLKEITTSCLNLLLKELEEYLRKYLLKLWDYFSS